MGFVNGSKDTKLIQASKVLEELSLEHFDINVCSPGNKRIKKESAKVIKDKKEKSVTTVDTVDPHPRKGYNAQLATRDNDIKSVAMPDMDMGTIVGVFILVSQSPCSYIQPAKPTVTIGQCHNLGFTRGSNGLVHTTLQDGPGMNVDTAPGEQTHQVKCHEGSIIATTCL